jgi:hypothetical protein
VGLVVLLLAEPGSPIRSGHRAARLLRLWRARARCSRRRRHRACWSVSWSAPEGSVPEPAASEQTASLARERLPARARIVTRGEVARGRTFAIVVRELTAAGWTGPSPLPAPVNNRGPTRPHRASLPDGSILYYFASKPSRRPRGGLDLYFSRRDAGGFVERARFNLGPSRETRRSTTTSPALPPSGGILVYATGPPPQLHPPRPLRSGNDVILERLEARQNSTLVFVKKAHGDASRAAAGSRSSRLDAVRSTRGRHRTRAFARPPGDFLYFASRPPSAASAASDHLPCGATALRRRGGRQRSELRARHNRRTTPVRPLNTEIR